MRDASCRPRYRFPYIAIIQVIASFNHHYDRFQSVSTPKLVRRGCSIRFCLLKRDAAQRLNELDANIVGAIFSRVLQRLPDATKSKHILSTNDLEAIGDGSTSLEAKQRAAHVLETIARDAVYRGLRDSKFASFVSELDLNADHAKRLCDVWSREAASVHDRLVDKSFDIADDRLVATNWKLKLITGQSNESCMKRAMVQIDLKTQHTGTSLELDHEDLSKVYSTLEEIASKIDLIQQQ